MDHNVTRGELKNLVTDKPSPITVKLAQKSDADGLFSLMDHNVTRGELKNLVTDKPSPITVKLAQKSDADGLFSLMDNNVTRGELKNLVTDKPSPITVKLAQMKKSDADGLFALGDQNVTRGNLKNLVTDKPSPITVKLAQNKASQLTKALSKVEKSDSDGLFSLMDNNVTRGELKNLVTDKPSPITVKLAQKKQDSDVDHQLNDHNVTKGHLKNLITDKDAPITVANVQTKNKGVPVLVNPVTLKDTMGEANLGMKILIGPDEIALHKKKEQPKNATAAAFAENPVENPPYNNWSVNQPSPPHQHGLDGKADLGQNIIVDGHHVHYLQTGFAAGMNGDEDMNESFNMGGQKYSFVQGKKPVTIGEALAQISYDHVDPHNPGDNERKITVEGDKVAGMKGTEEVHGAAIVGGTKVSYASTESIPQYMSVAGDKIEFPEFDEDRKNVTSVVQ
jgi:hypothetical protein